MDVQQGNVVTEDMLGKVKPGMTKSQVRFALGTPLISDPFHTDRWDYVYRFRKDGELIEHSRLTVVFEGDKLKTVEGTALPPSDNVAGTKSTAPKAVPALALAPEQPRRANPPLLDLKQLESDLEAAPPTPPAVEAANPGALDLKLGGDLEVAPPTPPAMEAANPAALDLKLDNGFEAAPPTPPPVVVAAKPITEQVQAEQPKRSFGERFSRLFGFGKKDETQQAKVEEKPEAVVAAKPITEQVQAEQPKRSFGERFMRLFGFGKEDETQQAKFEEKPEAQPEPQQEEEPPTNTVMTADRSPPPKRSVGERFTRLIGFKEKAGDDPAPPVTTEVNTSIPKISSLSFMKVMRQILGLEDDKDKDREKKAAAEDIEPGETVTSSGAQGSSWQRFKRLIGVGGDEVEVSTTPVSKEEQTTQAGNDAKPGTAKPEAAKP
ncbi:MAG TPA: outer membrane protein assembly factor BamE [Burkholderiales bacterium]